MTLLAALGTLAVSAFISSTLFPGGSEAVFLWFIHEFPTDGELGWSIATVANTAGSMTGYCIGRFLPRKIENQAIVYCKKYGVWTLLFAWLPIIGDALPVAAGWLRIHWLLSLIALFIGKGFRYAAIGWGFMQIF